MTSNSLKSPFKVPQFSEGNKASKVSYYMKFLKGDKVMVMGDPNTIGTVETIVNMNGEFKAIVDLGGYCSDQWIRNRSIYVSRIICDFSSIKRVSA